MFCTNCGRKLKEGEIFCPNCGVKSDKEITNTTGGDESKVKNSIDFGDVIKRAWKEFIALIKSPMETIETIRDKKEDIYIVFVIAAVLLSIINVTLWLSTEIVEAIKDVVMYSYFPSSRDLVKMFITSIFTNIAVIALTISTIYLAINKLLKDSTFTLKDSIKTVAPSYIYIMPLITIASVIVNVLPIVTNAIILLAIITNIILIYQGVSQYISKKSCALYISMVNIIFIVLSLIIRDVV